MSAPSFHSAAWLMRGLWFRGRGMHSVLRITFHWPGAKGFKTAQRKGSAKMACMKGHAVWVYRFVKMPGHGQVERSMPCGSCVQVHEDAQHCLHLLHQTLAAVFNVCRPLAVASDALAFYAAHLHRTVGCTRRSCHLGLQLGLR